MHERTCAGGAAGIIARPKLPWRIFFAALAASVVHGAALAQSAGPEPVLVGKRFVFDSKLLKEQRPYLVHLPASYAQTNGRYPVLILLDGDAHFTHTSGTVDYLAQNLRIPNMIVVGIPNTDRARDMTPPLPATATRTGTEGSPDGAKNFLSFIGDELLPHLDATYRTHPYRVLIGHSYGGLFATYALINRPEVFDAYLSISPSLWWDDQSLVDSTRKFLKEHRDLRADLFVTLGNEGGQMLGGYWKFAAALGESELPNLRWQIHRWTDETHGSVPLRSTQEGLQAIFDGYYVHDPLDMYNRVGVEGLTKHYREVSERLGFEVRIAEGVFAGLLYLLRDEKRMDDVGPVALEYLNTHPQSPQAHFSLASYYSDRSDSARAIDYYSRGLKLFPGNVEARSALAKLGVDPKAIVPEATPTARTLRAYVGRYKTEDGEARITLEGDKLFSASAAGKCELRAIADNEFYCVGADVEFRFKHDRAGRVNSVQVQQPTISYERKKIS